MRCPPGRATIESDTGATNGRDPYTRFHAVMPAEGPLTHAGLEVPAAPREPPKNRRLSILRLPHPAAR